MTRRFEPPWKVVEGAEAFWVETANGYRFGYCYFDAKPLVGTGREARLSKDEARRIATGIARLPELLGRG